MTTKVNNMMKVNATLIFHEHITEYLFPIIGVRDEEFLDSHCSQRHAYNKAT